MLRRTRFLAGTLALLAMTFSLGESVWASTCGMPLMERPPDHETPAGVHCGGHLEPGSEADGDSEGTPCPFSSPVAAQACAGVTSIPAEIASLPIRVSRAVVETPTLETFPGLLLEHTLFRPPRA